MNKENLVDKFGEKFPDEIKSLFNQIRSVIINAVPNAEEILSYQMPCYKLSGNLVCFAAYKNHIGFYPTTSGIENFKSEFGEYKYSKGAAQFQIDQPLPV